MRPLWPRRFATLTDAEQDNGVGRIYLGVHFRFDVDNGVTMHRQVADYVFKHGLVQGACRRATSPLRGTRVCSHYPSSIACSRHRTTQAGTTSVRSSRGQGAQALWLHGSPSPRERVTSQYQPDERGVGAGR